MNDEMAELRRVQRGIDLFKILASSLAVPLALLGASRLVGAAQRLDAVLIAPAAQEAASRQAGDGSAAVTVNSVRPGEIVREIDDPHNGDRWLLTYDARHPGGPGLLLRVVGAGGAAGPGSSLSLPATTEASGNRPQPSAGSEQGVPIIHAGDHVVVEENTPVVEARLAAIALGPALAGGVFHARLSVGGHVVEVIARAPGRVTLAAEPSVSLVADTAAGKAR